MVVIMWSIAASMGVAGILHLWIIPEHWQHAPAHGVIFLLLGIIQLAWAAFFLKNNSSRMQKAGILLAAGSIFLWGLTRILPAPFEEGPEALSISGIVVKLSELLSIVGLVSIKIRVLNSKVRALRLAGIQIILAFLIAIVVYITGKAAEPVFPTLKEKSHNHNDMHQEYSHGH